jgi:hypothetical protein
MDEADGRPGHVAHQFGHLDATHDAHPLSLCCSSSVKNLSASGRSHLGTGVSEESHASEKKAPAHQSCH